MRQNLRSSLPRRRHHVTSALSPAATGPRFRPVPFPLRKTVCEARDDGTLLLRCSQPLRTISENSFAGFAAHWAQRRGDAVAFAERGADGAWRIISWKELWHQMQVAGACLLELELGQGRPLMLLSGNSIEQAVLLLAAEYVGVPTVPVSPPYSLISKDLARLREIDEQVQPAALFAQSARTFERALQAVAKPDTRVIAVSDMRPGDLSWARLLGSELTPSRARMVQSAHEAIRPSHMARVLFTSGSTGVPKGVMHSYANYKAIAAYLLQVNEKLVDPQPVYLDWLPWHHAFGGVISLGRSVTLGAAHYIDDGRPLPGLFDKTIRNLHDISPTALGSVPVAWAMLADALERDTELARKLFAKAVNFGYGGASLPRATWERIQRVAERTTGERIVFVTGLGSTETAGGGSYCDWPTQDLGNIGGPANGTEIKLVPLPGHEGRYEIRVRGAHNFAGYLHRPDLTEAAFDEEGYFRLGDAVRLVDPQNPAHGLRFDGRVAEDFKLMSGTWVRASEVRLALVDRCAPLLSDAVICGQDRDQVAALAWPNVAACRKLDAALSGLSVEELVVHPLVVRAVQQRLRATASGASQSNLVERVMLMSEPPSLDANEIADKGYVNQAAARQRRAHLVEELYRPQAPAHVACAQ
ncbi:MAG: feruloyl-CoA synthase [Proteobacteria bacterium]|nr:feruloyl-CoA synthase [Pseudomonadota bacterium]